MEEVSVNDKHQVVVVYKGRSEVYDLSKVPDEKSGMVVREKQDILHQMDLKTVVANLDNSVALLNVAYHAVYGFAVQRKIFALQKNLMDLNDRGILVIGNFKAKSAMILLELVSVFKWLVKGAEPVAIGKLEKFADIAAGMSQDAQELAESYEAMADTTSNVLQETMTESSKQYEKSDNLRKMMAEFQAESDKASQLQESIDTRLKTLKQEYNSLKEAEEKAEKRENTLAIMGAVFSFLGSAASIASDVAARGSLQVPGDQGSQAKIDAANKKKEETAAKVQALETELVSLQTDLNQAIAEKDAAAEDAKAGIEQKISGFRSKIQTKRKELDQAKTEASSAKDALGAVSKLLDGASKATEQLQQGSAGKESIAQSRAERLAKIYDEMIRLEEENTKQLGMLAKYTKQMESIVIDQDATDAAIQALIIAITCLKRVVVAVKDFAVFLHSMEACCRALADSSLKDTIKELQEIDKAERIEYYYSEDVMYPLLSYMTKWAAIQNISAEFVVAAEKTRFRLNETLTGSDNTSMSREDHWNLASELAGQVSGELQGQIEQSRSKIHALEEKKTV